MKSSLEVQRDLYKAIEELRSRLKEKSDLVQAKETHGEELDEDVIDSDISKLEEIEEMVNDLDLSYI